jgi:hypothetical protein
MKQRLQEQSWASFTSARRMPRNQEYPGAQKNVMEALSIHYEPTFLVWGPTGHVISSQL